jgi:coatomer protein complex subunit alpha (xenin)
MLLLQLDLIQAGCMLTCGTHMQTKDDPARAAELAAYFTHCLLQPKHLVIALRSAMTVCYKAKLFATCSTFCRRLLELNLPEQAASKARQVLSACEANPTDAFKINYDPRNPFDLCAMTFVPIYRGSRSVSCPYTGAKFVPECAGKISPLGEVAKIGADASGLLISHTQVRCTHCSAVITA